MSHDNEVNESENEHTNAWSNRVLHDPAPEFLKVFRGYDRQQVDRWTQWQQQLVMRSRARVQELEAELGRLQEELERIVATPERVEALFHLASPKSRTSHSMRPRHLRVEREGDTERRAAQ